MSTTPPLPPAGAPGDRLGLSSIVPVMSRRVNLLRSRALVPALLMTGAAIALFWARSHIETVGDALLYFHILAAALLSAFFYLVYFYSGETESSVRYWAVAAVTFANAKYLYWAVWAPVFRERLALAEPSTYEADWPHTFVNYFIAAGLCEELLKATPILACMLVAFAVPRTEQGPGSWLALRGPLDGVLMGVASALAFTIWETNGGYVQGEIGGAKDPVYGLFSAMLLMMPRLMDGFGGHVGYSAIFGYFIGLAATHRRYAVRLLLIGWILSSALHAGWNSSWNDVTLVAAGGLTTLLFVACLMKARQLDASRLAAAGGHGSILAAPPPASAPGLPPPVPTGVAGALSRVVGAIETGVGVSAHVTVPRVADLAANPFAASGLAASRLALGTGAVRYGLAAGHSVDLSALFAAAGVGPGFAAAIDRASDGELALRNTGQVAWTASGPGGATISVVPGDVVAASEGTRLSLGGAELAVTRY